jgi:hypothetical protein
MRQDSGIEIPCKRYPIFGQSPSVGVRILDDGRVQSRQLIRAWMRRHVIPRPLKQDARQATVTIGRHLNSLNQITHRHGKTSKDWKSIVRELKIPTTIPWNEIGGDRWFNQRVHTVHNPLWINCDGLFWFSNDAASSSRYGCLDGDCGGRSAFAHHHRCE